MNRTNPVETTLAPTTNAMTTASPKTSHKMRKKADLPSKICPVCQRPFVWRKKWARDWDNVMYCSKRCQGMRHRAQMD
ncbi:DUF2256 domain-containing protein [Faucicola atlantae]